MVSCPDPYKRQLDPAIEGPVAEQPPSSDAASGISRHVEVDIQSHQRFVHTSGFKRHGSNDCASTLAEKGGSMRMQEELSGQLCTDVPTAGLEPAICWQQSEEHLRRLLL